MQMFGNSKKKKRKKWHHKYSYFCWGGGKLHTCPKKREHVFLFSLIIFEENLQAILRSKQTLRSNERRRQKITCSKRTNERALLIYPEEALLTGQFCLASLNLIPCYSFSSILNVVSSIANGCSKQKPSCTLVDNLLTHFRSVCRHSLFKKKKKNPPVLSIQGWIG